MTEGKDTYVSEKSHNIESLPQEKSERSFEIRKLKRVCP